MNKPPPEVWVMPNESLEQAAAQLPKRGGGKTFGAVIIAEPHDRQETWRPNGNTYLQGGFDSVRRGPSVLRPGKDFPTGDPLIHQRFSDERKGKRANSNGHFDNKWKLLRVECYRQEGRSVTHADGIRIGMAQGSYARECWIRDPYETGVHFLKGSRDAKLDLHVHAARAGKDGFQPTAYYADQCKGFSGHLEALGCDGVLELEGCTHWRVSVKAENCGAGPVVVVDEDCSDLQFDCMIQRAREPVFDFSMLNPNDSNWIGVAGSIRKSPNPTWLPPGGGEPRPLRTVNGGGHGNEWDTIMPFWV